MNLEKLTLGYSPLTKSVYVGVPNKSGTQWLKKEDKTNEFLDCVIRKWEGTKEIVSSGDSSWEISVRKLSAEESNNNRKKTKP